VSRLWPPTNTSPGGARQGATNLRESASLSSDNYNNNNNNGPSRSYNNETQITKSIVTIGAHLVLLGARTGVGRLAVAGALATITMYGSVRSKESVAKAC
jgi:hypothetical protein